MAAAQFVAATDQIFNQDPMRLLITPSSVWVVDLGDASGQLTVVMLEAAVHVSVLSALLHCS